MFDVRVTGGCGLGLKFMAAGLVDRRHSPAACSDPSTLPRWWKSISHSRPVAFTEKFRQLALLGCRIQDSGPHAEMLEDVWGFGLSQGYCL